VLEGFFKWGLGNSVVFFSFFVILKFWRNSTPKNSKSGRIYTRKIKISQFIYQKLAKFRQKKNTDSKLPLGGWGGVGRGIIKGGFGG
jgi:hypothetical protein